jgi:hypothetical protein
MTTKKTVLSFLFLENFLSAKKVKNVKKTKGIGSNKNEAKENAHLKVSIP